MRNIGIVLNITKDNNLEVTRSIVKWIESKGGNIFLNESIARNINKIHYSRTSEEIYRDSDFVIVLGGDGTILGVSREAAKYNTPLLGVNLGHLGFLAEVEVKEIFKSLEIAFNNKINTENRLMIQATVANGKNAESFHALNDIVITRGMLSRIVTLKIFINDNYVTTISGDGLIVATPTGSTAYSLSAGGPIISPGLSVITLTPICPHSLFKRSIVVSDTETIKIDLEDNHGDAYLTIDGQEGYDIKVDQKISICKSPYCTKLVKILGRSFYDVLRTKLTE